MSNIGSGISIVWERAQYVITNSISSKIQIVIQQYGSNIEIMFITVLVYIIWNMINYILREYVLKIKSISDNDQWKTVILKLAEFINSVLFFLLLGIVFSNLISVISIGNFNVFESLVYIISFLLIFFCIMHRLDILLSINLK